MLWPPPCSRGVRQFVVLGAGLDTYAYRGSCRDRARISKWIIRLRRRGNAGGLEAAGFDLTQQSFFTWLGVVPYLTEEAVWSTLGFIASLPNGAHVIFDYSDPPASLTPEIRAGHERRAAHVADLGEPWITYFEPDQLRAKLMSLRFSAVENLGPPQIALRYFPDRVAAAPDRGGHILHAATV